MTRLLLIDKRVREYQKLIDCAAPSVICMTFDYEGDTLSTILARLPPGPFESVGIIQDGTNRMREYRIVANQQPADVSSENPDMFTWADVRTFLADLQTPVVDFISCMLLSNPSFATAMTRLEADLGIDLRASRDRTGNLAAGGNWIQESDGVDIKGLYFTDAIAAYNHLLFSFVGINNSPFLNVKADGSNADWCMVTPAKEVLKPLFLSVPGLHSISVWGNSTYGGTDAPSGTEYTAIASTVAAFAALEPNGSISAWGYSFYGGTGAPSDTGYTDITSTIYAFAALGQNGSISAWGDYNAGGTGAPSGTGYTAIVSSGSAFAALGLDGSISGWGFFAFGGTGAPSGTGYTAIASNDAAFSALGPNGSISAWGAPDYGGTGAPSGTGYTAIASSGYAFSALGPNGSISAWGDSRYGGTGAPSGTGYTTITSNLYAFAALGPNGSISAWGDPADGGTGAPSGTGFAAIASSGRAFAAFNRTSLSVPSIPPITVNDSPCCPYIVRITETNTERTGHIVGNLLRQGIRDGRQPHMDASTWIRSRK